MSVVSLLQLLERLTPGVSRPEAEALLAEEPAWGKALHKQAEKLELLYRYERDLMAAGAQVLVGTDEVGRGPLAGPLVAAAVAFEGTPFIPGLRDSKQLSAQEREALIPWIEHCASSIRVTSIEVERISTGNLHHLSLEAMVTSVRGLSKRPCQVLVDGRFPLPLEEFSQVVIVGGDRKSACIAAASIVAKVTRDRYMLEQALRYPGYGFDGHKGYSTAEHLAALRRLGPSPIHRMNFAPCRQARQGELF